MKSTELLNRALKAAGCKFYEAEAYGSRGHVICGAIESAQRIHSTLAQLFDVKTIRSVRQVNDPSRVFGHRLEPCYKIFFAHKEAKAK